MSKANTWRVRRRSPRLPHPRRRTAPTAVHSQPRAQSKRPLHRQHSHVLDAATPGPPRVTAATRPAPVTRSKHVRFGGRHRNPPSRCIRQERDGRWLSGRRTQLAFCSPRGAGLKGHDDVAAVRIAAKSQRDLRVAVDVADARAGLAVHGDVVAAVPQEPDRPRERCVGRRYGRQPHDSSPRAGAARRARRTRCSRRSCRDPHRGGLASAGRRRRRCSFSSLSNRSRQTPMIRPAWPFGGKYSPRRWVI